MALSEDGSTRLQTRAYQLEMFNHSLQANTIVVMGTGTGKTHIASLRIDAELSRTPHKQVWFTAPNGGLVNQQLRFLQLELPQYRMKSLTGRDNVDTWNRGVWEVVLQDVNVVVATPQVLFDALTHAYVRLQSISLLVFDEAHHCQANTPSALIMQKFYHPQKTDMGFLDLPHVLGLTASPCISEKSASMTQLEANLDATCRSPTLSVEQYTQHVHKAVLIRIPFTEVLQQTSVLLQTLQDIVGATINDDDPYYQYLSKAAAEDDLRAAEKLRKYQRNGQTPAIAELRRFLGNAQYLHESLGTWASDLYITTCVAEWHESASNINKYHEPDSSQHQKFIDELLSPLRTKAVTPQAPTEAQVSDKAIQLILYLLSVYRDDIAIIVFVERRSVAWALCRLLQSNPLLQQYSICSYVGSSVVKAATLDKICTTTAREQAFLNFREGSRNLCIATSVAEEGLDVQAVNIVIRYDDPKQVVSYLQSRGRARQKDSRIVCFQDVNAEQGKYDLWDKFEEAMEEQYRKEERDVLDSSAPERQNEDYNEIYRVEATDARLDFNVSVSRLAHFCEKSRSRFGPLYLLEGETGVAVSARTLLPSCVPPSLREARSCQVWKSEKMARRDAAFHAMIALHKAGLINDHLLPFEEHKTSTPLVHEKQVRKVPAERQVWVACNSEIRPFAYRVELSHMQKKYLSLITILSTPLHQTLRFPLWETPLREIEVSVVPLGQVDDFYDAIAAEDMTKLLFQATFQAGSAWSSLNDPSRISCAISPEFDDVHLETESIKLEEFLHNHSWLRDLQPLLIWRDSRPRPYIWYPPHEIQRNSNGREIIIAKQVRKLQILSKTFGTEVGKASPPHDKELLLEDCQSRGVATVYGSIVLVLPSILHLVAAALRAQHANQTILRPIGFSSTELLVPALIAKSASGTFNYERLEFLGDTCLKYLASVQIFFDHPEAPEGVLTRKTHELIGNTRLEKAVNNTGLAPFITTEMPVQKHWRLPKTIEYSSVAETRDVLSKTLADVIESILGAAFLDGERDRQGIKKCITTLQLFLPEIEWRTPESHIEQYPQQSVKGVQQSLLQEPTVQMLGCRFENPKLLVEALTHSTDLILQPALDRLEFLGDAILDQIIKVKLFKYQNLDAGRLTLCRHALASHAYLAYRALSIGYDEISQGIPVSRDGNWTLVSETRRVELTNLIKFREASLRNPIVISKARYNGIKDSIDAELSSGRFPWTLLRSLNVPKVCSDIIESLLGALYLDSRGSLARCEKLLERIGLMRLLDQMAGNIDFEVRTPGTRLRELCAERKIALTIRPRCEQNGNSSRYLGEVHLEGNLPIIREGSCLEEAKSLVAEAAMEFLLMLQEPQSAMESRTSIDVEMSGMDHDGEENSFSCHGI